jgi:hypothetical protein
MIAFLLLVAALGLSANRIVWLLTDGASAKQHTIESSVATCIALGAAAFGFDKFGYNGGTCVLIFGVTLSQLVVKVENSKFTTSLATLCLLTYLALISG